MNQVNYQKELEKILNTLQEKGEAASDYRPPRLFLHSCCAPCSSYVLEYLAEHDGAMQKDIAAACRIEPATMTSLLCGMEKKGLITRSAPDRRSLSVYLTEKGRMLIPLIKEEFSRIEDRATCGFSDEARELLISLLSRMRENLD